MVTNVFGNQRGQCPRGSQQRFAKRVPDLRHSLLLRPPALFEVKGTISVDTALDRFIMILIR